MYFNVRISDVITVFTLSIQHHISLPYLSLTHLDRMDTSATSLWAALFPVAGCLVSFYKYCFIEIPVVNETM